jgi:hypothetical protein
LSPLAHKKKSHSRTLLFGIILLKQGRYFDYWNQPLIKRMRVCYLDSHEAGMCCYLVIHTENLLRPLQLFYFHLWPIYWLPRTYVLLAVKWLDCKDEHSSLLTFFMVYFTIIRFIRVHWRWWRREQWTHLQARLYLQDLKFSKRLLWTVLCLGYNVVYAVESPTDVSEEHVDSIFRIEEKSEQEAGSNFMTLWKLDRHFPSSEKGIRWSYSVGPETSYNCYLLLVCSNNDTNIWQAIQIILDCFLLGLLFDPEDGGDIFLRNVPWLSTDYVA